MTNEDNPRISHLLAAVTWLEVAILFWAGLGLLFYPSVVDPVWPWPLAPFNTRFLGALYSAALIAAYLQARTGRWSPARVVTPMIFIFTLVVTVFSFVHMERFDPNRVETWIWFGLYLGVCLNAGVHLWWYRTWPVPGRPPTGPTRVLLQALMICLGLYGMALLLAPTEASGFWPWTLDDFHAQLYSVTFLTPALGAWVLLRGATPLDQHTFGITLAAWGALPILGLVLADVLTRRIDWSTVDTWLWLALFGAMAATGTSLAVRARESG
ncbi:MAG: hypothetical protein IPG66_04610 [Hydrogenophilales bacterium]|nr:hypothetical protein [Hydrogenophilales bacterium]